MWAHSLLLSFYFSYIFLPIGAHGAPLALGPTPYFPDLPHCAALRCAAPRWGGGGKPARGVTAGRPGLHDLHFVRVDLHFGGGGSTNF